MYSPRRRQATEQEDHSSVLADIVWALVMKAHWGRRWAQQVGSGQAGVVWACMCHMGQKTGRGTVQLAERSLTCSGLYALILLGVSLLGSVPLIGR